MVLTIFDDFSGNCNLITCDALSLMGFNPLSTRPQNLTVEFQCDLRETSALLNFFMDQLDRQKTLYPSEYKFCATLSDSKLQLYELLGIYLENICFGEYSYSSSTMIDVTLTLYVDQITRIT